MVPDPRSWIRGPIRALRAHRVLALAFGLASGIGALAVAIHYAHPSLYEYLLLPLGVGGSVYYLAHYDLGGWDQEAKVRGFLRLFAMILLANAVVPETEPLADGMVSVVTVFGVLFFVVLTAVVDVIGDPVESHADDHREIDGGTAREGNDGVGPD